MLATAKSYRENVIAISKSSMPLDRKRQIISGMLEQIAIISKEDTMTLPKNLKALSDAERDILESIYFEVRETLEKLT